MICMRMSESQVTIAECTHQVTIAECTHQVTIAECTPPRRTVSGPEAQPKLRSSNRRFQTTNRFMLSLVSKSGQSSETLLPKPQNQRQASHQNRCFNR